MTVSRKRSTKPQSLRRGDVIKTHPRDGYWGCAVVLSEPHEQKDLHPLCHIGITPIVIRHDYGWAEIEDTELSILEFDRGIRTAPLSYRTRHETCIGLYTSHSHPLLPIIGSVDPARVFTAPLAFEVGDGTEGRYPLCGRIAPHLGSEAVISWMRLHDPAQWQLVVDAARESYERVSATLKEEEREKRRSRRRRKGA
jgi:hypothetical protein